MVSWTDISGFEWVFAKKYRLSDFEISRAARPVKIGHKTGIVFKLETSVNSYCKYILNETLCTSKENICLILIYYP